MIDEQSRARPGEAQKLVWEIDKKLQEAGPADDLPTVGATCLRPEVKSLTIMVNSIYNGWRMEDVWLER